MRAMTSSAAMASVVALGFTLATPAQATAPPSGDPALYWNQAPAGGLAGSPTITSRSYAMVSAAMRGTVDSTSGDSDA